MRLDITNKFKRGWQVDINPATKPNISDLLTGCDKNMVITINYIMITNNWLINKYSNFFLIFMTFWNFFSKFVVLYSK